MYVDVWGPASVRTKGGNRYFISFTDDATRETHLYLMAEKSQALPKTRAFVEWCQNQQNKSLKCLQSDNGGEFIGEAYTKFLEEKGIRHRLTVHHLPQQNGTEERQHRTMVEHARAMLYAAKLPRTLWGEAVSHAVWLKN